MALAQLGLDPDVDICSFLSHARLGQLDRISPLRMAEMLEVDKAGQKVRC
jgi:hypothetical protein